MRFGLKMPSTSSIYHAVSTKYTNTSYNIKTPIQSTICMKYKRSDTQAIEFEKHHYPINLCGNFTDVQLLHPWLFKGTDSLSTIFHYEKGFVEEEEVVYVLTRNSKNDLGDWSMGKETQNIFSIGWSLTDSGLWI